MGAVIQLPISQRQKSTSLSQWLDEYMGCNVDKLVQGDNKEIKKHDQHLAERNIKERNKMLED